MARVDVFEAFQDSAMIDTKRAIVFAQRCVTKMFGPAQDAQNVAERICNFPLPSPVLTVTHVVFESGALSVPHCSTVSVS